MKLKKRVIRRLVMFNLGYLALMALLLGSIWLLAHDDGEARAILFFLLAIAGAPVVLFAVLYACGKYTGSFDRYIAGLDLAAQERFERELQTAPRLRKGILCAACLVIENGMRLDVVPYERLVWAYRSRQSISFVPVRQLMLVTDDKKLHALDLGRKLDSKETEEFLRFLVSKQPQLLLGYDDEKEQMFRTNFEGMKYLAGR